MLLKVRIGDAATHFEHTFVHIRVVKEKAREFDPPYPNGLDDRIWRLLQTLF